MRRYVQFFLVFVCMALALTGCSFFSESGDAQKTSGQQNSYAYKPAKQTDELSPEEQHKRARALVDPNAMVQHNAYVKNAEDVKAGIDQHSRVAKIQDDVSGVQSEFKGLKSIISRADIVPPTPVKATGAHVQGVRLGEYPDKTRIVFDLDSAADFEFDIDNAENLLVISLPGTAWNTASERVFHTSKLLRAYVAKPAQAGGSVVAVKLRGPSKVLRSAKLGKNAAGMHRIFLDIAPL